MLVWQTERFEQAIASQQRWWNEGDDVGLFSKHRLDTLGQIKASQRCVCPFANPTGCPDLRLAFRNVRETFQSRRNCFGKELFDVYRIKFFRFVRGLAFHQIYLVSTASLSYNIDVAFRVLERNG